VNSSAPIYGTSSVARVYGRSRAVGRTAIKRDLLRIKVLATALSAASLATPIVARFGLVCGRGAVSATEVSYGELAFYMNSLEENHAKLHGANCRHDVLAD
jgi:hypothetical protein